MRISHVYTYNPSLLNLPHFPHPTPVSHHRTHRAELLVLYGSYFTHDMVYMRILL